MDNKNPLKRGCFIHLCNNTPLIDKIKHTMKITINKNAQEKLHKKHVNSVISKAKRTAEMGSDLFYYPIPRGIGLSAYELIVMVEKETEDTVYGGIKDGGIKFRIR